MDIKQHKYDHKDPKIPTATIKIKWLVSDKTESTTLQYKLHKNKFGQLMLMIDEEYDSYRNFA